MFFREKFKPNISGFTVPASDPIVRCKRGFSGKLSRALAMLAGALTIVSFSVKAIEEVDVPIPDHKPKAKNVMFVGQSGGTKLWPFKGLEKRNKRLTFEVNGNLVLYAGEQAVWSTQTAGSCPGWAELSPYTGLTVYDCRSEVLYQQFNKTEHSNFHLELSRTGLNLYDMDERKKVWSVPLDQCNEYPCGESDESKSIDTLAVKNIWKAQGWGVPMPAGETGSDQNFDAFLHHFSDFEKNGNHADAHRYLKALAVQKCHIEYGKDCSEVSFTLKQKAYQWVYGNKFLTSWCAVYSGVLNPCFAAKPVKNIVESNEFIATLSTFAEFIEDGTLPVEVFFRPWEGYLNTINAEGVVLGLTDLVERAENWFSRDNGRQLQNNGQTATTNTTNTTNTTTTPTPIPGVQGNCFASDQGMWTDIMAKKAFENDYLSRVDLAFEAKGSFSDIQSIVSSAGGNLAGVLGGIKSFDSIQVRFFGSWPIYDETNGLVTTTLTLRLMNLTAVGYKNSFLSNLHISDDAGLSVNHEFVWTFQRDCKTKEMHHIKTDYSSSLGLLAEMDANLLEAVSAVAGSKIQAAARAMHIKVSSAVKEVRDTYADFQAFKAAFNEEIEIGNFDPDAGYGYSMPDGYGDKIEQIGVLEESLALLSEVSEDGLDLISDLDSPDRDFFNLEELGGVITFSLDPDLFDEFVEKFGAEIEGGGWEMSQDENGNLIELYKEYDDLSAAELASVESSIEDNDSLDDTIENLLETASPDGEVEEPVAIAASKMLRAFNKAFTVMSEISTVEAGFVGGLKTTWTLRKRDFNGGNVAELPGGTGAMIGIIAAEAFFYAAPQAAFLMIKGAVPLQISNLVKSFGEIANYFITDSLLRYGFEAKAPDMVRHRAGVGFFAASKPTANTILGTGTIFIPTGLPQLWMPLSWDMFNPVFRARFQVNYDLLSSHDFAWRRLKKTSSQELEIVSSHQHDEVPVIISQLQTFNEPDTAYIETRKSLDLDSTVELVLAEETTQDNERQHEAEMMAGVGFREGNILNKHGLTIGEAGVLGSGSSASYAFQPFNMTLEFKNRYINPIVVLHISDKHKWNWDTAVLKTTNKSSTSVDIVVQEWDLFADGARFLDEISYIVLEAGIHRLQSGELLVANKQNGYGWDFATVFFKGLDQARFEFDSGSSPVVFTQVNDQYLGLASPVIPRIRGVNLRSFEQILQLEENNTDGSFAPNNWLSPVPQKLWSVYSQVDYIAIETRIPEEKATYCAASGGQDEALGFLYYVDLDGKGKISGQESYSKTDDTGMTIEPGETKWMGFITRDPFEGVLPQNVYAYIDYNQDGNFDASEIVFHTMNERMNWGPFTVPSDAKMGKTRMRVMYNHEIGVTAPCGVFSSGEVEDYTITIE